MTRIRLIAAVLLVSAGLYSSASAEVVPPGAREFGIARLKYGVGGDW